MTIKRYVAANSREAMSLVRRDLGDEAIILSNKRSGAGVEILACAPDAVDAFVDRAATRLADAAEPAAAAQPAQIAEPALSAEADGAEPQSFADYLRRRDAAPAAAAPRARVAPVLAAYDDLAEDAEPAAAPARVAPRRAAAPAPRAAVREERQPRAVRTESARTEAPRPRALLESAPREEALLAEVQAMRALLEGQLQALTLNESQRRNPAQAQVMTRLLSAGFSPRLAREVSGRLPAESSLEADQWLAELLAKNLRCAGAGESLFERGGVFSLVGPTGVGKTTTVAKLAARFAVAHGAGSLGLITLDSYRIGAHEQLRTYGRILGVPVHLAQDEETLAELLDSMQHKKLVLIDTCGVSQRDQRCAETVALLDRQGVQRVLMLNAAAHTETLDDVARAWHAADGAGAILTKLDEAVKIGGALDVVLRHKLMVLGLTNGQRVPEDWHAAKATVLSHLALKPGPAHTLLDENEAGPLARADLMQAQAQPREAAHA